MGLLTSLLGAGIALAKTAKPHTFVGKLLGTKSKPKTNAPEPEQHYAPNTASSSTSKAVSLDINGDGKSDTIWIVVGVALLAFLYMKKK